MDQGLYHGIAGMADAERRLQIVADNLANIGTSGFKRRQSFTEALNRAGGGIHRDLATRSTVDFSQGVLRRTGNTYDLALTGEGFFAIDTPQGEVYTRSGSFHVDAAGVLSTEDGHPVAWDQVERPIDPTGEAVRIGGGGQVIQGLEEIGRLRIVDFADPGQLRRDGSGNWQAPRGVSFVTHNAVVQQGAIEDSNVTSMEELVELIMVQRAYDSAANVVKSIDGSYRRLHQAS